MINSIDEAIAHAKEKAEELTIKSNELYEENYEESSRCQECASEHEQLADWLEELKARREADRWISVKERMPEPRVAVMVYCPEHKNQYCAFYENKHWWVFGAYGTVWEEVTHWKPLPKAPESEAANE